MNARPVRGVITLLLALMLVAAGFVAGTSVFGALASTVNAPVEINVSSTVPQMNDIETRYTEVYNRVSPSVVAISVVTATGAGSGSGFVIDTSGHIVTNYHVVQDAEQVIVNFLDGTITRAQIIGVDPDSDLAVIKVDLDASRLFPVTVGDSNALEIGQMTLAIGSPFNQRWTLTAGIVSALERSISGFNVGFSIGGAIQTDTAINPGNSGGPLLNLDGEVIGVNAQIRSQTGSNSGIGFAIPSNLVVRVAQDLIQTGRVDYSYIGIRGGSVSLGLMEDLNLPNDTRGVYVTDVIAGGPADSAGLKSPVVTRLNSGAARVQQADIITAINDRELNDMDALVAYLATNTRPGDTVTLTVLRTGESLQIPLTLAARPSAN
ncbi:MAG TPA: trypsin-like peptidase domain-containing protein [Aggregatilineales bacterium]|jgi:S1-C subfamily serine protease|nr:trypsin-like peptidase domain-containing protein [Aggregatilineales bacterium]